jgi:hypothetical protein
LKVLFINTPLKSIVKTVSQYHHPRVSPLSSLLLRVA